jgi:hypothetical protein
MIRTHKLVRLIEDSAPDHCGFALCDGKSKWVGILSGDNAKVTCKKCLAIIKKQEATNE